MVLMNINKIPDVPAYIIPLHIPSIKKPRHFQFTSCLTKVCLLVSTVEERLSYIVCYDYHSIIHFIYNTQDSFQFQKKN